MKLQYPSRSAGLAAGVMFLATSAGGCVNARDEYDDFSGRVIDASTIQIDAPIVSNLPDPTGEWLLTARPDLGGGDYLLRFRVTYAFTPVTENTGTLDYTAYALDVDTGEPVGDPWSSEDLEVRADATFDVPLYGTLHGDANPISGGPVFLDATLHGTIIADDFLCGTATGTAGSLPLDGTTWATVRITGDTLPDPVWRCEDRPQ